MSERNPPNRLLQLGLPVLAAAGTVGALGFARGRFQQSRLFAPERYPMGDWQPEALGSEIRDAWFEVDDLRLHGWWIPAVSPPPQRPAATILYCHGNSGSIAVRVEVLRFLRSLSVNLLAFDYRGYGRSEGKPSEAGLFRDARAAYRYLVEDLAVDPATVILLGHSMGGAVAIDAALELPVPGLVIESTFTDIREMARSRYRRLPMHLIARNQFQNLEKVGRLEMPKLFIHGTSDTTVPIEMSHRLFAEATDPKTFLPIEGAEHNDLHLSGDAYLGGLRRFINSCLGF